MAKTPSSPDFPPGWEIVGLYKEGRGVRVVDHGKVRSRDVIRADAIIVRHTNPTTGVQTHRTIHGAKDKRQIGRIIDQVVQIVSPV